MGAGAESRDGCGYPSTHWSRIFEATLPEQQAGEGALNRLLARYYAPLLAHLEYRFRLPRLEAEDLLQGFIYRNILARQCLARADRARGRFRTFLLNVLDNYVKDELRARDCARRRPAGGWVALDEATESWELHTAPDGGDPFAREWALAVLAEAEAETRRFYVSKGREDTWGAFHDAVLAPVKDDGARPGDEEIARRHGFKSARQASNALITAKQQFGKILRDVVARYAESDVDVDAELRELMAVVTRKGSGVRGAGDGEFGPPQRLPSKPEPQQAEHGDAPAGQAQARFFASSDLCRKAGLPPYSLKELPGEVPSPPPPSSAGQPAELLALGLAAAQPWRPEELAAVWEYHLSAPLQFDLGGLDPAQARELRNLSAAQGLLLASLRGLLQHPVPPLELLEMVKDFAKACLRAPDPPLPPELAGALYHLAIAVALTRLGERITNLGDAEIRSGLDWALARPWLDTSSRVALAQARRLVAESGSTPDAQHG